MTFFERLGQAARSTPASVAFVVLATLTGAYLWTSFDLRWTNWSSGYMRMTIASDVAEGGLPPLLLGTIITGARQRLAPAAPRPRNQFASGIAFVAAALAGAIFGTLVTAISRIVTGTFFVL